MLPTLFAYLLLLMFLGVIAYFLNKLPVPDPFKPAIYVLEVIVVLVILFMALRPWLPAEFR